LSTEARCRSRWTEKSEMGCPIFSRFFEKVGDGNHHQPY
jgi:hypothetical protein